MLLSSYIPPFEPAKSTNNTKEERWRSHDDGLLSAFITFYAVVLPRERSITTSNFIITRQRRRHHRR